MEDVLVYHGILGQKWGVRRFQNPDGSLTSAGKKRYDSGTGRTDGANDGINSDGKRRPALLRRRRELILSGLSTMDISKGMQNIRDGKGSYKTSGNDLIRTPAFKSQKVTEYNKLYSQYTSLSGESRDKFVKNLTEAYRKLSYYPDGVKTPSSDNLSEITKMINAVASDEAKKNVEEAEQEILDMESNQMSAIMRELGVDGAVLHKKRNDGKIQLVYMVTSPFTGKATEWPTNRLSAMKEWIESEKTKQQEYVNKRNQAAIKQDEAYKKQRAAEEAKQKEYAEKRTQAAIKQDKASKKRQFAHSETLIDVLIHSEDDVRRGRRFVQNLFLEG